MSKTSVRKKSWKYKNTLVWKGGKQGNLTSAEKPQIQVSTPADFGGPEGMWTPEDFLVAAVNSCIMTTFLYLRGKNHIDLTYYESIAEGEIVSEGGELQFASIVIRPNVGVKGPDDVGKAHEAFSRVEQMCLISKAIDSEVSVEPRVEAGHKGTSKRKGTTHEVADIE